MKLRVCPKSGEYLVQACFERVNITIGNVGNWGKASELGHEATPGEWSGFSLDLTTLTKEQAEKLYELVADIGEDDE